MHRLGFLERPKMSCMCVQFSQPARNDMFGTKAAYRAHGGGMLDAVKTCLTRGTSTPGLEPGAAAECY